MNAQLNANNFIDLSTVALAVAVALPVTVDVAMSQSTASQEGM